MLELPEQHSCDVAVWTHCVQTNNMIQILPEAPGGLLLIGYYSVAINYLEISEAALCQTIHMTFMNKCENIIIVNKVSHKASKTS